MMIHDTQMHFISFKLTGRCYLFASRGFISLPVKARAQMNYSYVFCLSVGLWIKFKPRFTCVSCLASACLSDILISYETFYIYGQNCKRNIQPLGQILVYHSLFQFLTKKNKKISVAIQEKKDCFEGGCWHFTLKTRVMWKSPVLWPLIVMQQQRASALTLASHKKMQQTLCCN